MKKRKAQKKADPFCCQKSKRKLTKSTYLSVRICAVGLYLPRKAEKSVKCSEKYKKGKT